MGVPIPAITRTSPMVTRGPYLIHADSVRSEEYSTKPEGPDPYCLHFATTVYGAGSHVGRFGPSNPSGMLAILASDRGHISDKSFSARVDTYLGKGTSP